MELAYRMKKRVKLLSLIITIFFCAIIIFYFYNISNENYLYTQDFKKTALEQGYSDLEYHSEYYQIYENRLHYLILVKGNANKYIVKKSAGLSQLDIRKLRLIELNNTSKISLEPSSLLVGNTRVKNLNGYLYWRFTNEKGDVIYIDYFKIEKRIK